MEHMNAIYFHKFQPSDFNLSQLDPANSSTQQFSILVLSSIYDQIFQVTSFFPSDFQTKIYKLFSFLPCVLHAPVLTSIISQPKQYQVRNNNYEALYCELFSIFRLECSPRYFAFIHVRPITRCQSCSLLQWMISCPDVDTVLAVTLMLNIIAKTLVFVLQLSPRHRHVPITSAGRGHRGILCVPPCDHSSLDYL